MTAATARDTVTLEVLENPPPLAVTMNGPPAVVAIKIPLEFNQEEKIYG